MFDKRWIFAVLISLFVCVGAAVADDGDKSVISIENAQKTEYKKDAVSGADTIVLTGGVRISVTRGSTKTTILADSVNYNRETDMIYAEGNVHLDQTGSKAGGESVTAKSLLFNTATLEGVFDNGRVVQTQSDALNLPSGSTLNVASSIFGRDSGGTIAFKNGELTFCDDDDPHWRIKATRIWLLPGGEFAFFNALLYVGHVPLLYFPAFYYPKDELIFNPAFGYRNREGYYINTTTYIFGRKPLDARSSVQANKAQGSSTDSDSDDSDDKINFFSLMKTNALKEQRREGLVLHNLDDDYTGDTSTYLKFMADYYANLGLMVGLDGAYKPNDIVTNLQGNLRLGWSNTIFQKDTTYLPYAESGEAYSDSSNFMGIEFPFRYAANFAITIAKPLSLTISLPMYSDPYFEYDFGNRAESMDWIDFLMSNPTANRDTVTIEDYAKSSFEWKMSGSYTQKLPDAINPFITSLAVSSFTSSVSFGTLSLGKYDGYTLGTDAAKYNKEQWYKDDYITGVGTGQSPERKFYYPSQIKPLETTLRFAGTVVQYPATKTTTAKATTTLALKAPAALDTEPKEEASDETEAQETDAEDAEPSEKPLYDENALPLLNPSLDALVTISDVTYKLDYSVAPYFTSQLSYSSDNLKAPDDFSWNDVQSTYYQVKVPTTVTSALGYRGSFVSLTDTFTFNPVYQDHPYFKELNEDKDNGGYTKSSIASLQTADYKARKLDLTDVNALTFKPLYYTKYFSETSLTWNTTLKMIRTEYIGTTDSQTNEVEAEWDYLTADVTDEESLTVHNINVVLAAKEGEFGQNLSLTTTLPPLVDEYKGVFSLTFPYTTFSIGTGIKQTSKDDDTWIKEDISQSLAVTLLNSNVKFAQSWQYDLEDDYHESFKLALSGYGFQLAYTMSYVKGYDFDVDVGWVQQSEEKFQPYSVSLAYTSPSKTFTYWTDRISFAPSLSTSIVYDCLRPTNSYFKFIPAFTFKINNFLQITFSAESRNDVIYRYVQKYTGTEIELPGETNVFKDLLHSFYLSDEDKRKSSGFKLKTFSVTVTHDLHDWDFSASFSITPKLITESSTKPPFDNTRNNGHQYYDFSPKFTLSVVWRPMESMKTEIVDEYGEWELNP